MINLLSKNIQPQVPASNWIESFIKKLHQRFLKVNWKLLSLDITLSSLDIVKAMPKSTAVQSLILGYQASSQLTKTDFSPQYFHKTLIKRSSTYLLNLTEDASIMNLNQNFIFYTTTKRLEFKRLTNLKSIFSSNFFFLPF